MESKRVALVTGANKGIGLQIAKDLAGHGFRVLVGSRNLENGEKAAKTIVGDAQAVQLDVTDQGSIDAAAALIERQFGHLDVLVNNAGISHTGRLAVTTLEEGLKAGRLSVAPVEDLRAIFATNVFGVLAVTQAMLPLLKKSTAARIVNISSSVGSLTLSSDPAHMFNAMYGIYSSSKTALNGITVGLASALKPFGIKVNAVCPGYVATDLNAFTGTRTVEEGAREPVRLALLGPDGPTGTYTDENGPIPW